MVYFLGLTEEIKMTEGSSTGRSQTYPSTTMTEYSYYSIKNSSTRKQSRSKTKNSDFAKSTREFQKQLRQHNRNTWFFPLHITSKDTRLHILQDPTNSVAIRNPDRTRLWNDYVFQITTRQNTLHSATLFSSKDGHSASKMEISSTAGQHGWASVYPNPMWR
jgi:UTP:GlnB (protein PII) uridylyltransferase